MFVEGVYENVNEQIKFVCFIFIAMKDGEKKKSAENIIKFIAVS